MLSDANFNFLQHYYKSKEDPITLNSKNGWKSVFLKVKLQQSRDAAAYVANATKIFATNARILGNYRFL